MRAAANKSLVLHIATIVILFVLQFVLPEYHQLVVTRIMLLGIFALGFNLVFGYAGLLSLGHAMFFSAGLYGAGLTAYHLNWSTSLAFGSGIVLGLFLATLIGLIALRTKGVAFMIVTLMFSQVVYLAIIYFTEYTRGEEGLVIPEAARVIKIFDSQLYLSNPNVRYNLALLLLSVVLVILFVLVKGKFGRALIAIRENENRTKMLGYDTRKIKLQALIISGTISSIAGSAYALMFAYIGASFATIQYSIDPLLYTLLGGAGTLLGPLFGTTLMFYLIDIVSNYTHAYLLVSGIVLVILVLYFPKGILGTLRERWLPWLP